MDEWRTVTVDEVATDVTVGHVGPMAGEYQDEGIPFLRSLNVEPFVVRTEGLKYISGEFHNRLRKSALRPGDVVIVRTGKPGACAVVPDWLEDANCSDLVIVRCGERIRPRFLAYVVNSLAGHHVSSHTVGAVQQHFNVGSARTLSFQLPSISSQDAILKILGALDDKIELNRRMNETLEAMARAIFKDWFADFGPTRAKMEGREPYLAPDLWSLFPDRLDEEGKPEGWASLPFKTLLSEHVGGDWGGDAPTAELPLAVRIIRGTDLSDIAAGNKDRVPLRYTSDRKLSTRRLKDLDIVVEVSGGSPKQPTGRSLLVTDSVLERFREPVECATFCRLFRPKSPSNAFLAAEHLSALYSRGGTWEYQNQSTGISNFQTKRFLEAEQIIWPGEIIANAFGTTIEPMIRKKYSNESITLAATRDLLLPKLMSGEIRVQDAEMIAGEAA